MRTLLRVSRPLAANALCLTVWRKYKRFGQIDFDGLDVAAEQLGLPEATQNSVEDPAYAAAVYGHLRAGKPHEALHVMERAVNLDRKVGAVYERPYLNQLEFRLLRGRMAES